MEKNNSSITETFIFSICNILANVLELHEKNRKTGKIKQEEEEMPYCTELQQII